MIPYDPLHLYRLHEAELVREAENRRRTREFLAERAQERRSARDALRADRRARRTGTGGLLMALLLLARRS